MTKHYHQIIVLILAVVFVAACTATPTSTPAPTVTVSAPTNPPPTDGPTTVPPTPTALPATVTNTPPTTVPSTDEGETDANQENSNVMETNIMNIKIGDTLLTATLAENSSVNALKEALAEGPITVDMRDYGNMEKVGSLGMDLPRNDEQITTEAGDLILYQGSAFVIYYAPNSWNFTRLGKINDVTAEELKDILGDGNVTVTLSLPHESESPEVIQLDSGKISGIPGNDPSVMVYKGIPYAAPPVGDLRWKAPQPVEPWEGVMVADSFGNSAIQPPQDPFMMWTEEFIISNKNYSEDSLTLNVWTDTSSTEGQKPVIVFIHGGALTSGGSSCEVYFGDEIAKKDVVYVSINYRLGIFGFFAHPELTQESPDNVSGNYGVLDAIAALQWVKNNIAAFGGDPDNVTIMGQSAGSRMVHALMITPLAKGLFHKAVAESANPIMADVMGANSLTDQEALGTAVMEYLGINSLEELRAMSAEELQEKVSQYDSGGGRPGYPTAITMDGYVITGTDLDVYKQGVQNDVPLMTGSVTGDAALFGGSEPVTLAQYEETAIAQYGDKAEEFLALYPAANDDEVTFMNNNVVAIHRMNMLIYALAEARALHGESDTYMYYFTRSMPAANGVPSYGAFHTADVPYFLNYFYQDPTRPWEEVDYALGETMSSYLLNFAKTGNPNGEELPIWPAFSDERVDLIELGNEVQLYADMTKEQADFWKAYFNSSLGL